MRGLTVKHTLLAVTVAAALGMAYGQHYGTQPFATAYAANTGGTESTPLVAQRLPDMTGIVARNGAAVVNISVEGTKKVALGAELPGLAPDDPMAELFRHFQGGQQSEYVPIHGQGSGFIVSADGIILTNAHVVNGADEVNVKLTDKREYKAKVLGLDKTSDVAVLKIDAKNLPTVSIGSAAQTRVGEWVLAIGSPFGFENSASAGIVSAKSRALPDGSYVPFIQTDVAVNPGNSGGPLFNMNGEVIGINSQIYSRSGGYQGISFAIPIDLAMNIEQQIVSTGKVQRGRLGVTAQELNQALAESFGLGSPNGALVSSVEKGGPAASAGLQTGDVILSLDNKPISGSAELAASVSTLKPGQQVQLKIWRQGNAMDVTATVGSFSDNKVARAGDNTPAKGKLGVAVRPLSPAEAGGQGGLLVEQASGPAARAGVQAGDIILSINGRPVTSVEALKAELAKNSKQVAILISRGDQRLFVPVDLG
jgi:serine protease Do